MTKTFTLYWIAEDGQSSLNGGEFASRAAADAALPSFKAVLLDQCGDADQVAGIEAGRFSIEEDDEN